MADQPVVHIGENSPERIAYLLYTDVKNAERDTRKEPLDRKYILDTFAECLKTVKNLRPAPPSR